MSDKTNAPSPMSPGTVIPKGRVWFPFFRGLIPSWLNMGDDDLHKTQARILWRKGWGRELGIRTFPQYLAKVPPILQSLIPEDPLLTRLILCDPRPGHIVSARMAGIRHGELGNSEGDILPWDTRHEDGTEPFWLRAHDGRPNRDRPSSGCRASCMGDLLAGTAKVGIALYLHDHTIVKGDNRDHVMVLPGSVHRDSRVHCAFLEACFGSVELNVGMDDRASPHFGSVVFRRK